MKNRNVIRKAIKEGVIIKEGSEYLNVCADLIKLTMARQGIKFYVNLEDLQRMQAHLRDEIKFYIAYKVVLLLYTVKVMQLIICMAEV